MPGLSLSPHGTSNANCNNGQLRTVNQMCRQDSRTSECSEDEVIAESSFLIYCKPIELYNYLGHRAKQNPPFLQRCLDYKIKAKHRRRIKMTISLSRSKNKGLQAENILPLYALLVTPVPGLAIGGHSAVYFCRTRAHILTCYREFENHDCRAAAFVLPEMDKLSDESKSGKLSVLFVSCGSKSNSYFEGGILNKNMNSSTFPVSIGGYCLWGTIPMESLCISWKKDRNKRSEDEIYDVDMRSCFLESTNLEKEQCITFKTPDNSVTMQVHVNVSAQENGKDKSPYGLLTNDSLHASLPPYIMRMRMGNVVFNYKCCNNKLRKTEVTEDFSCPFCLIKCSSFQGLKNHLCASHDLFSFEFWVTRDFQAVNVSVKKDTVRSESASGGTDPKLNTFILCKKPLKRLSKSSSQNGKHIHTREQKLDSYENTRNGILSALLEKKAGTSSSPVHIITSSVDTEPSDQHAQICDDDAHSHKAEDQTLKDCIIENDALKGKAADSTGATDADIVQGMELVASSPNVTGVSSATALSSAGLECLPLSSGSNLAPSTELQLKGKAADSNWATNADIALGMELVASSPNVPGVLSATALSSAGLECLPLSSGRNLAPSTMLQFAKSRKLSADRSDPRNRLLLQKRQFYHSHKGQPMELEEVLSDRDSEDEVDDDIADLEDRRMLDDIVDLPRDEKYIMHLWNSFIRRQRVLADGHIPWAFEKFSNKYGAEFAQVPALFWGWRLFMVKLWNHHLLDSRTMDKCSQILLEFQNGTSGTNES